jgi:hypothetical protein
MKQWQRVLVAVVPMICLYGLWRYPSGGIAFICFLACAILFSRAMLRTNTTVNPLGKERDYSLRPVALTALKALAALISGVVWPLLATIFDERIGIPENWLGLSIVIGPSLVFMACGAVYTKRALKQFQFGDPNREL